VADPVSGAYLWSSLTFFNNALYVGIASLGDCPLVRGALVRIDLAHPAEPQFRMLAPEDQLGGGVWSTPAIDPATNTVYVTTGTGEQDADSGMWGGTMLALDATTLEIVSYFFLPTNSVDYDIAVPSDAKLWVRNAFGNVEIRGARAWNDVENSHGQLTVRDVGAGKLTNSFGTVEAG